jgi:hypothetical protein
MPSSRNQRPLAEQYEEWTAHLRRQVVSRRTVFRGAVGAAAGSLPLGSGRWADQAVAATLARTGTIAGGFVVNGRHLSFGADPATEMWDLRDGRLVRGPVRRLRLHRAGRHPAPPAPRPP